MLSLECIARTLALVALTASLSAASQLPFGKSDQDGYFRFSHEIKRVAVVGAGPSGLQVAAALLENGMQVRLFERKDRCGGNWYYQDELAVDVSYP